MRSSLQPKAIWGGRAALAALVLALPAATASAQSLDPGRAFRGLFVPNAVGTTASLAADVYQGANRRTGESGFGGSESIFDQGVFTGVTGNFGMSHTGRYTAVGASALGMVRYFADSGEVRSLYHGGAFGLRRQGRRIGIELQQQVGAQPAYEFGNLRTMTAQKLGGLGNVDPDHASDGYSLFTSSSSVALGVQSRQRQWLRLGYGYAYSHIARRDLTLPDAPVTSFHAQDLSVGTSQQLWKNTGVRFDFKASRGGIQQLGDAGTWIYNINAGLDRMQNLSLTRTTSMNLGFGGSVVNDARGRRYVVLGAGGIDKRFGRSTRAGLSVRRDVNFVEGLAEPVLTNGLAASLDTQPSPRWRFSGRVGASRGRANLTSEGATVGYDSYGVNARLRVKLTGPFAAYGEYVLFHQRFEAADNPLFLADAIQRNGIRVGLVIDLPFFGQRGVE